MVRFLSRTKDVPMSTLNLISLSTIVLPANEMLPYFHVRKFGEEKNVEDLPKWKSHQIFDIQNTNPISACGVSGINTT